MPIGRNKLAEERYGTRTRIKRQHDPELFDKVVNVYMDDLKKLSTNLQYDKLDGSLTSSNVSEDRIKEFRLTIKQNRSYYDVKVSRSLRYRRSEEKIYQDITSVGMVTKRLPTILSRAISIYKNAMEESQKTLGYELKQRLEGVVKVTGGEFPKIVLDDGTTIHISESFVKDKEYRIGLDANLDDITLVSKIMSLKEDDRKKIKDIALSII